MTRRERRFGRLLVITPPIVVGAAAALGIAYVLSPLAPVGLTRLAEPSPGLRWDPGVVVPGVFIVLAVALAVPARRRLQPTGAATDAPRSARLGGPRVANGNRLGVSGQGAVPSSESSCPPPVSWERQRWSIHSTTYWRHQPCTERASMPAASSTTAPTSEQ